MQAFAIKSSYLTTAVEPSKYDKVPARKPSPSTAQPPGPTTGVLFQRPPDITYDDTRLERLRQAPVKPPSWLKSQPLTANDQASVARATRVPRRWLERLSIMSTICSAWALTSGAKSGIAAPFSGDGQVLGSLNTLLVGFGLCDAVLTRFAQQAAETQARQQRDLLLAQHLLLDKLKTVLRRHPQDLMAQAALDVALFNIGMLNRLLDAHDKEHEAPDRLDDLRQLRQYRADLCVQASRTARRRRLAARHAGSAVHQARYKRNKKQFDQISQNVAMLEKRLQQAPLAWAARLWDEGFDSLHLNDVTGARDFWIPVLKAPADLTMAACTISAESLSQLGQELMAQTLETATAGINLCLLPFNLASAVLDLLGGELLHDKAGNNKQDAQETLAHLQRVYNLYLNEADPLKRAVCLETIFQRMKTLQEVLAHAHRVGRMGQARRLKGLTSLCVALLNAQSGAQTAAHKGSLAASLPATVLAGASAVMFLGLLATTLFTNWRKEKEAKQQELQALQYVTVHGVNRVPHELLHKRFGAGLGPRQDHPRLPGGHLIQEWLTAQLMHLHEDITQPISGVEQLLLDMARPAHRARVGETLYYLRSVSLLTSLADFRMIVRAVVGELMGENSHAPEPLVNESLPNMLLSDEDLMPAQQRPDGLHAAGPASGSFHLLSSASKTAGRERLKGPKGGWPRWLRSLLGVVGRNSLATPSRTLAQFHRLEKRDHRRSPTECQRVDRLSRHILRRLLEQLPREDDGHTLVWPEGLQGDTGECLCTLLTQMVKDCNRAAAALAGAAASCPDTRSLAKRLQAQARVASRLSQHVKREQNRDLPWWNWLPPAGAKAAA